jgi:Zn-dependent protease/predicted transcriptional regulator
MFGLPAVRLGRPFGIPLEVDASWMFIFLLVSSSLSTSYFPAALPNSGPVLYVALGTATALAFFGSLVLHELAHSLVARAGGLKVTKVTLFLFGGVSQMEDEPRSAGHELLLAVAGPLTSVLIGLASLALVALLGVLKAPGPIWLPFEYLGFINFSLAAFNMLPGFPLDGGRVFRAILWAITGDMLKATRWASRAGQVIGMSLMAVAVFGVLSGTFDFVWLAVMGWFLSNMSASAYRQQVIRATLAEVPLRQVMSAPAVLAPADLSLEEMAHSYFLGGRHTRYPVVDEGHVVGLIDLARVQNVPRESWSSTTVAEVAAADLTGIVASPDASVGSVLSQLEPGGSGAVLVVEDRRLAGIVTRADVIRFIREASQHS